MHQTDFDLTAGRFGRCSQCEFKAVLFCKPVPAVNTLGPQDVVDEPVIKELCPTCFDTPPGTQSMNQRHRKHGV